MARRFPAVQSPPSPCCQAAEPNSKPRVAGRGFGEGQATGSSVTPRLRWIGRPESNRRRPARELPRRLLTLTYEGLMARVER